MRRLKRLRTEISSNFDSQESAKLIGFNYDAAAVGNMPSNSTSDLSAEDWNSNRPIVIKQYKVEVATTVIAMMWQYYCEKADEPIASNWDFAMGDLGASPSSIFRASLKQKKMISGGYVGKAGPSGESQDYSAFSNVHTLHFKARGYFSKKHKEWRWIVPPIVLSASKKDCFGISVANISSGSNDRSFIASIEFRDWYTIT